MVRIEAGHSIAIYEWGEEPDGVAPKGVTTWPLHEG
jgi:hypothetical protein